MALGFIFRQGIWLCTLHLLVSSFVLDQQKMGMQINFNAHITHQHNDQWRPFKLTINIPIHRPRFI